MDLLDGVVMPYAWGSRSALARLLRREPSGGPEAELWMGAHPRAPAVAARGGVAAGLDRWIANDPLGELGAACVARWGARLPFQLKLLAAEQPLSIQVHPSDAQAADGFAREEAAGVALDAPTRRYADPHGKAELLLALEPVEALVGLRAPAEAARLLASFGVTGGPVADRARGGDLRGALGALFSLDAASAHALVARVAGAAPAEHPWEAALVARLAALHPGDVGVAVALLLAPVHLAPLEAVALPPGVLHAYLSGVGVEITAGSDNVLRGGLTPKPVDPEELLRVVDVGARPVALSARDTRGGPLGVPGASFELTRLELDDAPFDAPRRGPELLFCERGAAEVRAASGTLTLRAGAVAFSPFRDGPLRFVGAGAHLFRATTPP